MALIWVQDRPDPQPCRLFTAVRRGSHTTVISWTENYASLPAGFRAVVITRVWREVRKSIRDI